MAKRIARLLLTALVTVCAALALGCGESVVPTPPDVPESRTVARETPQATLPIPTPTPDVSADTAVAVQNPGGTPVTVNLPTAIPPSAQADGLITWTQLPTFTQWSLDAAGQLQEGVSLVDWELEKAPAFAVYYKGHTEPLALLLPDLPAGQQWDTHQTIAPTDFDQIGTDFSIRAFSPLFGDTGGNLELHAFGYNAEGEAVTLAVIAIR